MKPADPTVARAKPAPGQDRPARAGPEPLRALLVGGDRRSIARGDEALALLRADPARVAELARLTDDDDWLVVMRAMDLMEKLAHECPQRIQPHRKLFIGPLAQHPSWEIRLQVARALPLLDWSLTERERVVAILLRYANDAQKFVKAWALDSLSRLAARDAALLPVVERLLDAFERSGSPALAARARQIRSRAAAAPTSAIARGRH